GAPIIGAGSGEPWGYLAQEGYYTDSETGLQLLGRRYYDPGQGRFLNRDPAGADGGSNLYAYCADNPITSADPGGLQPSAQKGCKEAKAINDAVTRVCTAVHLASSGCTDGRQLLHCLDGLCGDDFTINCGMPGCGLNPVTGDINCGFTAPDGTITICTGVAGDFRMCGAPFDVPGGTSPTDLIAITILHEMTHKCGVLDHWPGRGKDPGDYNNPAEVYARCMLGIPGRLLGYLNPGESPDS
ncbi:MAG TPA: RHS repeat-associated core domain-containing protein, partial [Armatimonadota bacterium]|nr:RHS repeat-associated core domain-containing protein [Armatimonadota bacterium]